MEKVFKEKQNISVQDWLLVDKIFENGIVRLKNNSYIKIIQIIPINYNLKSELEKEAILNSFKIFLKTCNFNFQILVQTNKADLSKHISCVKNSVKKENKNIKEISEKYIEYLNYLNSTKKSATKNFYIIVKKEKKVIEKNKIEDIQNIESIIFDELNECYLVVKDTLSRCGNSVININNSDVCKNVIYSFL